MASGPLYLGFDLSTQQLKAIVISSNLKVHHEVKADFDADLGSKYGVKKGVKSNPEDHSVYAPVAMWLEAVDIVLARLHDDKCPFERIKGISGAGQQHGSVFWSPKGEDLLGSLRKEESLVGQLENGFAHPWSPNWQDGSTQRECEAFEEKLGGPESLADITGSRAHHVS
jgi:xylulokinase